DRKSTRLNSSHVKISYAVFCLKKINTGVMLEGRSLRIEVADAGLRFDYTWRSRAFRATEHGNVSPDLTIRANLWDFHQLLQRGEVPDTLFFSRRLVMEGDTELGLLVKNTLYFFNNAAPTEIYTLSLHDALPI